MSGAKADGAASTNHAKTLRDEGNEHFKHERLHEALESFSRSLFAQESHLTYQNRSLVYLRLGEPAKALQDAQRGLIIEETAKGFYRVAVALVALKRPSEALRACEKGLKLSPGHAELILVKSKAMLAIAAPTAEADSDDDDVEDGEGEEDEEDEEDELSDDEYDDDEDDDEKEEEEEEAEAERLAALSAARFAAFEKRACAAPPASAPAPKPAAPPPPPPPAPPLEAPLSAAECKERGNGLYKAGEYEQANGWYSRAVEGATDDTERAVYLCNRAAALVMLGRVPEAASDAGRAAKLDGGSAKAYARLGKCHLQLGELTEARLALAKAEELAPAMRGVADDLHSAKLAEALAEQGAAHAASAEQGRALDTYALLLSRYCPHSEHFKFLQLDAIVQLGRYEEVLSQATAMLRRSPDSPNALYLRGKCLFHSGQVDSALKHAAEALRLDPDHAPAKALRLSIKALVAEKEAGNAAFKAGDYAGAEQRYTAALALAGERDAMRSTLHVNRAAARARMQQHEGAIADCTDALSLDAKNVKALLRRAACHLELQAFDAAAEDYGLAAERATDEEGQKSARSLQRKAKLEKLKAARVDHYKVLEVERGASAAEIKKAYRRMALRWHPDKNAGSAEETAAAEAQFKVVNEAYDTLSDPAKKERFDSGVDLEAELDGGHGGRGGHSHMDPEMYNMFRSFMGGPPGGRPRGGGGRMPRGAYDF